MVNGVVFDDKYEFLEQTILGEVSELLNYRHLLSRGAEAEEIIMFNKESSSP